MKILQVTAPREYEILDVPIPVPGAGEVLVRVLAVTTCPQWDLHLRHNEPMFVGHRFEYPYMAGQPGHEAAGVIEAVGSGVAGLAVGDTVCIWRDSGHHVPGCYAQFVTHPAENVIRVPANLPPEAVAPLELAMCIAAVFRMFVDMDVIRGRCFGVVGLGPAGLVALQMARAEGAESVFGFDPVESRRELALRIGADGCYDPTAGIDGEFPMRPFARLGSSVDCVGAKASVEFAMDRTQDAVGLFGVQREDYTYKVHHHGVRLCGYRWHCRESAEYAVGLIEAGKLDLSGLVTHRMPLEAYGEAVDLLETQQAVKVALLPWA